MKKIRDLQRLFERHGLLYEDDYDSDEWFGSSGFGGEGGSDSAMYKAFVQPFTDVIETGQAVVSSTISSITTGARIILSSTLQIIIPFIKADFKQILNDDKARQKAIRDKYKDVFARNEAALFESGGIYDGAGVIGVLFPHYMVANNLTKLAGKITGPVIGETLTAAKGIVSTFGIRWNKSNESYSRFIHKYSHMLLEDDSKNDEQEELAKLIDVIRNINPTKDGTLIREMFKNGIELIQATSTELAETANKRINEFQNVKSIEQLEKLVGKKPNLSPKQGEPIDENDAQKILDDVLPDINERISTGFMRAIESYKNSLLEKAKELNVPEKQQELITNVIEEVISKYDVLKKLAKK